MAKMDRWTLITLRNRLQTTYEETLNLQLLMRTLSTGLYDVVPAIDLSEIASDLYDKITVLDRVAGSDEDVVSDEPQVEHVSASNEVIKSKEALKEFAEEERHRVRLVPPGAKSIDVRQVNWGMLREFEESNREAEFFVKRLKELLIQRMTGLEVSFDIGFHYAGVDRFAGVHDIVTACDKILNRYSLALGAKRGHTMFSIDEYHVIPQISLFVVPLRHLEHPEFWCYLAHENAHRLISHREQLARWLDIIRDSLNVPEQWADLTINVRAWVEELFCDALALRISGPAYILAQKSRFAPPLFFTQESTAHDIGRTIFKPDVPYTHPPIHFRLRTLIEFCQDDAFRTYFAIPDYFLNGKIQSLLQFIDVHTTEAISEIMQFLTKSKKLQKRMEDLLDLLHFALDEPDTIMDVVWDSLPATKRLLSKGALDDVKQKVAKLDLLTVLERYKNLYDSMCESCSEASKSEASELKPDYLWDQKRDMILIADELRGTHMLSDFLFNDKKRAHRWMFNRCIHLEVLYGLAHEMLGLSLSGKCRFDIGFHPTTDAPAEILWFKETREVNELLENAELVGLDNEDEIQNIRKTLEGGGVVSSELDPRKIINALWLCDEKLMGTKRIVKAVVDSLNL
jgi:hypothetical protein